MKNILKDIPDYRRIILGRSARKRDAFKLGLISILWLPASFMDAMKGSFRQVIGGLLNVIAGTIAAVVCVVLWALVRVTLVIAGCMGFLTLEPQPRVDDPGAVS